MIFTVVLNAVMIGVYIMTLEKTTTFFKQELDNSIMHHEPSLLEVEKVFELASC